MNPPYPTSAEPDSWTRHAASLRRLAQELLRGDATAAAATEDLVQHALLQAVARPPRKLSKTWLARVLENRVVDERRRAERQRRFESKRREELKSASDSTTGDPVAVAARFEAIESVARGLRAMSANDQEILHARYFEDLTPTEIAARGGLPIKTVKTRLTRAHARLRQQLAAHPEEERDRDLGVALAPLLISPSAAHISGASAATSTSSWLSVLGTVLVMKRLIAIVVVLTLAGFAVFASGLLDQAPPPQTQGPQAGVAPATGPDIPAAPQHSSESDDRSELKLDEPDATASTPTALVVTIRWSDDTLADNLGVVIRHNRPHLPNWATQIGTSDMNGEVRFDKLAAGKYSVSTDRATFATTTVEADTVSQFELKLDPGVSVTGVVVDVSGAPVAGADVWLATWGDSWTAGRVCTQTGAEGRFSIREVEAGQSIGAFAPGFAPSELIDLDDQDTSNMAVAIRLELKNPGCTLQGQVLDHQGQPVVSARVAIKVETRGVGMRSSGGMLERWTPRTALTDSDGAFDFRSLPVGEWDVAVKSMSHPVWSGSVTLEAAAANTLDVHLQESARIVGVARDEAGAPSPRATIRALPAAVRRSFLPGGQFDFDDMFDYPATTAGEDGAYVVDHLPVGEAHLYATPAKFTRNEGQGVPRAESVLTLAPGETANWDPVIGSGHTIAGAVTFRDGAAMKNVFVSVVEEDTGERYSLNTGRKNTFRFCNVRMTSCTVSVQLWDAPKGSPPLAQAGVFPDAAPLTMIASYDSPSDTKSNATLKGILQDTSNRIAEGDAIGVQLHTESNSWHSSKVGKDGEFSFSHLSAGKHRLIAISGGQTVALLADIDIAASEAKDIGTVTTRVAGTLVASIKRGPRATETEAIAMIKLDDARSQRIVLEPSMDELRLPNMEPGTYEVRISGDQIATRIVESFVIQTGQTTSVDFEVKAGRQCQIELVFPSGVELGALTTELRDASGASSFKYTSNQTHLMKRPIKKSYWIAMGSRTFVASTSTGFSGQVELVVDDVQGEPRTYRLEMQQSN